MGHRFQGLSVFSTTPGALPVLTRTRSGSPCSWACSTVTLRFCAHMRLGCFSLCSMARSRRAARWPSPALTRPGQPPLPRPLLLHRAMFEDGHQLPHSLQTQTPKVCLAGAVLAPHKGPALLTQGLTPAPPRRHVQPSDECEAFQTSFKPDSHTRHCTLRGVVLGGSVSVRLGEASSRVELSSGAPDEAAVVCCSPLCRHRSTAEEEGGARWRGSAVAPVSKSSGPGARQHVTVQSHLV